MKMQPLAILALLLLSFACGRNDAGTPANAYDRGALLTLQLPPRLQGQSANVRIWDASASHLLLEKSPDFRLDQALDHLARLQVNVPQSFNSKEVYLSVYARPGEEAASWSLVHQGRVDLHLPMTIPLGDEAEAGASASAGPSVLKMDANEILKPVTTLPSAPPSPTFSALAAQVEIVSPAFSRGTNSPTVSEVCAHMQQLFGATNPADTAPRNCSLLSFRTQNAERLSALIESRGGIQPWGQEVLSGKDLTLKMWEKYALQHQCDSSGFFVGTSTHPGIIKKFTEGRRLFLTVESPAGSYFQSVNNWAEGRIGYTEFEVLHPGGLPQGSVRKVYVVTDFYPPNGGIEMRMLGSFDRNGNWIPFEGRGPGIVKIQPQYLDMASKPPLRCQPNGDVVAECMTSQAESSAMQALQEQAGRGARYKAAAGKVLRSGGIMAILTAAPGVIGEAWRNPYDYYSGETVAEYYGRLLGAGCDSVGAAVEGVIGGSSLTDGSEDQSLQDRRDQLTWIWSRERLEGKLEDFEKAQQLREANLRAYMATGRTRDEFFAVNYWIPLVDPLTGLDAEGIRNFLAANPEGGGRKKLRRARDYK